jgi:hypothetical protein
MTDWGKLLTRSKSTNMRKWTKRALLVFLAIVLATGSGLWGLRVIAEHNGVSEVMLPYPTILQGFENGADYADAYALRLKPGVNLGRVIDSAFAKFTELKRSENEIVYTDTAPGLRFYVLYHLDAAVNPTTLTMATIVHYDSLQGKLYFTLIRPFHRSLTPFMLSRMLRHSWRAMFESE